MGTKVTLRRKPITQARESLYLDFYPPIRSKSTMKLVHKEYLGIYIFQEPRNEIQRDYNTEMLLKAEAIRAIRVQSCINEEFGFLDKEKMKGDFLDYFKKICRHKDQKWGKVYLHFANFVDGHCTFADISVDLVRRFSDYLMTAPQLKHTEKRLKTNSIAGYYSTFRALLKIAYRDKRIRENINDFLEKIEYEDTKREFLTLDEFRQLVNTPCDIPVLRRASIFSCFTGLRISDILQLKWEHIVRASDGDWCMRIRTEKTETEATLPVSDEALEYCGKRGEGIVFKGLERYMTAYPLQKWLKKTRITKHITFHCARHTFGTTVTLSNGLPIETLSKMLGHSTIRATQVYAKILDSKMNQDIELLDEKIAGMQGNYMTS